MQERYDREHARTAGATRRSVLGALALGSIGLAAACAPGGNPTPTPMPTPTPTPTRPPTANPPAASPGGSPGWSLVWEDDFRTGIDPAVWTRADYGGNRDLGELQYNDPSMAVVEGGNLVLHARRQSKGGYPYIAGSISSKDKLTIGPYGRLTTRQLLGPGVGLGFAVALYGSDIDDVGWPACGELDATEVALARPGSPFASAHGPGYSGGSPISTVGNVSSLVDRWAVHTLTWDRTRISWAIDRQEYHVVDRTDPRAAAAWPFDQPFFITMVLTIGSALSGPVDEITWPANSAGVEPYAVVDFVRFEQRTL